MPLGQTSTEGYAKHTYTTRAVFITTIDCETLWQGRRVLNLVAYAEPPFWVCHEERIVSARRR